MNSIKLCADKEKPDVLLNEYGLIRDRLTFDSGHLKHEPE